MRLRFWLGFAVVATIAIGSIALALIVHGRESDSFERTQRSEAIRSARQAEALANLSIGQLASAAAFYQAEGRFSQHEFDVIADSLLSSGGLTATVFVDSVPSSARARYERNHGFQITERGPLGELRRARARTWYFPLSNAAASGLTVQPPLGFDLGSDPQRSPYLVKARDSGEPAATRVMRLPVGGAGINVFRPVYRDGAPTGTVAQRRAALTGFAAGGFAVPDLARAATSALPGEVDVALFEHSRPVSGPAVPREDGATAPVRIADRTWLLVVRDPSRPGVSLPLMIAIVGLCLAALLAALVLIWSRRERMQELARQASHDSLTGLKNRRRFEEDLRTELARSHRYGTPGAMLMLDLDRFKQVNDTLGHPAGDRVLAEIAKALRRRARETDVIARLGGDEFAIVLPRCDLAEARSVAGEITEAIREQVPVGEKAGRITASIGIAQFGTGRRLSYETLLADADAALYAAKEAGGDRVRAYGESGDAAPNGASGAAPSLAP